MRYSLLFWVSIVFFGYGCEEYSFQEVPELEYNTFDDPNVDLIHFVKDTLEPFLVYRYTYTTDYASLPLKYQNQINKVAVLVNGSLRYEWDKEGGRFPLQLTEGVTYDIELAFRNLDNEITRIYERKVITP